MNKDTDHTAKPPEPPAAQDLFRKPEAGKDESDKKPDELTPEELRLMADTMPGDGPGGD